MLGGYLKGFIIFFNRLSVSKIKKIKSLMVVILSAFTINLLLLFDYSIESCEICDREDGEDKPFPCVCYDAKTKF